MSAAVQCLRLHNSCGYRTKIFFLHSIMQLHKSRTSNSRLDFFTRIGWPINFNGNRIIERRGVETLVATLNFLRQDLSWRLRPSEMQQHHNILGLTCKRLDSPTYFSGLPESWTHFGLDVFLILHHDPTSITFLSFLNLCHALPWIYQNHVSCKHRTFIHMLRLTVHPQEVIEELEERETVPAVRWLHLQGGIHVGRIQAEEGFSMFYHQVWPPCKCLWIEEGVRSKSIVEKFRKRKFSWLDKNTEWVFNSELLTVTLNATGGWGRRHGGSASLFNQLVALRTSCLSSREAPHIFGHKQTL